MQLTSLSRFGIVSYSPYKMREMSSLSLSLTPAQEISNECLSCTSLSSPSLTNDRTRYAIASPRGDTTPTPVNIPVTVEDQKDGRYLVSYTPTKDGIWAVDVKIKGFACFPSFSFLNSSFDFFRRGSSKEPIQCPSHCWQRLF